MKAYLIFDDKEKQTQFTERAWEYIKASGKEIDIPDKFTEMKVIAGSLCDINAVVRIIPIPRPKRKVVKKWRWYMDDWGHPGGVHVSPAHHTEEDAKRTYEGHKFLCKIPETETEVEVSE